MSWSKPGWAASANLTHDSRSATKVGSSLLDVDVLINVAERGEPVPQFNAALKQGRFDVVCGKVRAVCMTIMDENRLVRASKLCPDDRSEHLHGFFRDHLQHQIERKMPLTRAVVVDDVGKFSNG
jgi:hypothetical protein